MDFRKKNKILLAISLTIFLFAYITDPISGNLCRFINYDCTSLVKGDLGVLFFLFSGAISIISFLFLFLREEIFHSWWKFARIYLPIAFGLILLSSFSSGGGLLIGSGGGFDQEGMIWFTAGFFLVISLFVIAKKSWTLRKKNKNISKDNPTPPISQNSEDKNT